MCMMVDGFQFYWDLSKLGLPGERFRISDWISYQLFTLRLPQFCKMLGLVIGYILTTRSYTIFQQLGKSTLICITIWQGNLEVNTSTDLVLTCLVLFLVHYFHWNDHNPCIFVLKGTNFKLKSLVQVQYNESLANFACSSSTEEYWPSVVFVRTSGKCSLVWPSGLGRSYYLWL